MRPKLPRLVQQAHLDIQAYRPGPRRIRLGVVLTSRMAPAPGSQEQLARVTFQKFGIQKAGLAKSTFMHARIAIWNYMNRCLTGTPYAHALNTVEVYDVRGLYSKMKGLLNKCTLMTLSVTTISLFKLMSECSATKDPAVYYSELTEKATLVEEMARQVDKDSGTNATGGFIIPKFLITVSLIHALDRKAHV